MRIQFGSKNNCWQLLRCGWAFTPWPASWRNDPVFLLEDSLEDHPYAAII
jgi:hypothetical protein